MSKNTAWRISGSAKRSSVAASQRLAAANPYLAAENEPAKSSSAPAGESLRKLSAESASGWRQCGGISESASGWLSGQPSLKWRKSAGESGAGEKLAAISLHRATNRRRLPKASSQPGEESSGLIAVSATDGGVRLIAARRDW